jgi:hypothetical protein
VITDLQIVWLAEIAISLSELAHLSAGDGFSFVRSLGLKSHSGWIKYCASGRKPHDIPSAPIAVYAKSGWNGWGDWLGSGTKNSPSYLPQHRGNR